MASQVYTISGSVTINGLTIPIRSRNDAIAVRMLIDAYITATDAMPTSATDAIITHQEKVDASNYPKNGFNNTTKGFIQEVFSIDPYPTYAADLVEKMKRNGWNSNADDPKRYIEVVMYRNKDTFTHYKGGKWGLVHWGNKNADNSDLQQPANETDASI